MNDQTRKALELAKAAIFRMDIFGNEDETTAAIDAALSAPAAPVARPLTDKQITEVINDHFLSSGNATSGEMVMRFARAIERAHGISQGGDNA